MGVTSMDVSAARAAIAKVGVVRPPPRRVRNARVNDDCLDALERQGQGDGACRPAPTDPRQPLQEGAKGCEQQGKDEVGVSIRCVASSRSALFPHHSKSPGPLGTKTVRQIAGAKSRNTE